MNEIPQLIDPFLRPITYLRVSATDRCDFRCSYCMSENMTFLPKKELLSLEELERICTIFIKLGVRKLRVTGGEPLVRRGIIGFFQSVSQHLGQGLDELTLTTNGSQLAKYSEQLNALGVQRVNVSLDTLDSDKFTKITRWGRLKQVKNGIKSAQDAGLRVKINMVALKGFNEDELFSMLEWCAIDDMDITFIEVMPMGEIGNNDRLDTFWSMTELRKRLETQYSLVDLPLSTGGPAKYVKLEETGQTVGFITPLTHNFCEGCNRVRLTCTGELFMCLGQEDKADFRDLMRANPNDDAPVIDAIRNAIKRKPKGHDFDYSRQKVAGKVSRHMSHTGG